MQKKNVDVLIDPVTKKWRAELVNHTFSGDDATHILRIPLAIDEQDDMLV